MNNLNLISSSRGGIGEFGLDTKNLNKSDEKLFKKDLSQFQEKENLKRGSFKDYTLDNKRPKEIEKSETKKPNATQEERRSEPQEKVQRSAGKAQVKKNLNQREKVIQKFMDSIESEFGIPPQRVVEAMAKLEDQELKLPPEQTAEKMISDLDLAPEQSEKMLGMYLSMNQELSKLDVDGFKSIATSNPAIIADAQSQQRFLNQKMQQTQISEGLDKLNNKFWMKNSKLENENLISSAQEGLENTQAGELTDSFSLKSDGDLNAVDKNLIRAQNPLADSANGLEQIPSGEIFRNNDSAKVLQEMNKTREQNADTQAVSNKGSEFIDLKQLQMAAATAGLAQKSSVSSESASNETKSSDSDEFFGLRESAQQSHLNLKEGQLSQEALFDNNNSSNENNLNFSQFKSADGNFGNSKMGNKEFSTEFKNISQSSLTDKDKSKDDSTVGIQGQGNQGVPVDQLNSLKIQPAEQKNPLQQLTTQDKENVQQLMKEAQYLIKNGGGEVSVQMTPEGLGKVQLKLDLKDGRLNVQMTAENQETKKIIEESLKDLKNSLSSHKLSVDHVKVDTVQGASTENNSQSQMNFNSDSQRESTKQFWNQYREQFGQQNRDGYFDIPNMSKYGNRMKREPSVPSLDESSVSSRRSEGRSQGLNMVA